MGLLTGILGLPVAPLRGTIAVANQVLEQAEKEYYDPARIRAELDEVARLRDAGELTDDEAIAWEDNLIERLMISNQRAREERHG
ncbi:MAG TPA: gas vesicle protein GvpG [Intrasporangium sp.]|uniref:gas vesicle protein GvpG n=1 Tax=Nocardioides sp. TaxID=35761 RepID=UPI002E51DC4F|nr:gas vesicle protein GvpG [Intrasporangium sp.]